MKDDLKPCPFCGAKPTLKRAGEIVGISCGKETGCDNTGLFLCFAADKEAEAIAAWNRRALLASSASDKQEAAGQWVHCSPALLSAGVSCANTPRRACACQPENGGHDHFIAHTAQEWRERWYGSDPERGWSILQGRDVVAYIGGDESMSDAVRAIVDAHNAVIAKEQK